MGLPGFIKGWIARRELAAAAKQAKEWAARDAVLAELERKEKGMDKLGPFLKGLGVAFVSGIASAAVDYFQNGGFEFSKEGVYKALGASIAAGLIAGAAYLKRSPLHPPEPKPEEAPKG